MAISPDLRAIVRAVWDDDLAGTGPEPSRSDRQHREVIAAGWTCPSWGRYAHPRRHPVGVSLTTARAFARVRGDGRWPAKKMSIARLDAVIGVVFEQAAKVGDHG
jgi:hypothetical protein